MRQTLFVDTSAWYALADRSDANHRSAAEIVRRLTYNGDYLATTNHVVAETYTLVRQRLGSDVSLTFLTRIRRSPSTQRVFVDERWEEAAEDLLRRYADQRFSYVDATSFVAMNRLGLDRAFAFDRHFRTAGFALVT